MCEKLATHIHTYIPAVHVYTHVHHCVYYDNYVHMENGDK